MKLNPNYPATIDEKIDAALRLLNEMQPPETMVGRVHQRLEVAAARSQRVRARGLFWIPAAGGAIGVILLAIFSQTHDVRQASPAESATVVTVTPASREMAASRPALAPAASSKWKNPALQPAVVRRSRREHPQYRHAANLFNYPLTKQEKLLVRFAETANPADMQMLNQEYQAKVEAQQEAEFTAYLKSGDGSSSQETAN